MASEHSDESFPQMLETGELQKQLPMRLLDLQVKERSFACEANTRRMSEGELDAALVRCSEALWKASLTDMIYSERVQRLRMNWLHRIRNMSSSERGAEADMYDKRHAETVAKFNKEFSEFKVEHARQLEKLGERNEK